MSELICTLRFVEPAPGEQGKDVKLDLDPSFYTNTFLYNYLTHGEYAEPEVVQLMTKVLRPGDTFVDGGACVGYHTAIAAALVGAQGAVHAFEPHAGNRQWIDRNVMLNGFTNVILTSNALSDHDGIEHFYEVGDDQDTGHCSLGEFTTQYGHEVRTVRLDSMYPLLGEYPRLLKLDIEGAEFLALQGARHLLDKGVPPFVTCELNWMGLERLGTSIPELRAFMLAFGYHTWLLAPEGGMPHLVPPNTNLMPWKLNFNCLFASIESVGAVWDLVRGTEFSPAEKATILAAMAGKVDLRALK